MHILLIDDDPAIHETVAPWLSSRGFSVTSAEGRAQALAILEEVRPSVVIIDASLPGSDTVVLCSELHRVCPDLPVLMLSASEELLVRKSADATARLHALEERVRGLIAP